MKILITGALSGIGFLTGVVLHNRGHEVILSVHRDSEVKTLTEKLNKLKLKINTLKLDITSKDDREIINNLELDVLINNAAIGVGGSIIDIDIDSVRKNFEVNLFSSFELAKIFCRELLDKHKKGKLIVVSSLSAIVPIEFLGSYCSSKSAVTMMTKCLRKELKKISKDISVCLVMPGIYMTGFNDYMINDFYYNTNEKSYFYDKKEKIYKSLKNKFMLLQKENLNSIVCQIIFAVENKKRHFTYSAPFSNYIFSRLYSIFFS